MRRLTAAILVPLLLTASACGDDSGSTTSTGSSSSTDTPSAAGSPSSTATAATPSEAPSSTDAADGSSPVTIPVTVDGSEVTPNGDRVPVEVGQDVVLDITADAPGEIHVHSTPEQEFEYGTGSTKLTISGLDQPGIVTIESHTIDKVIVQLEVS